MQNHVYVVRRVVLPPERDIASVIRYSKRVLAAATEPHPSDLVVGFFPLSFARDLVSLSIDEEIRQESLDLIDRLDDEGRKAKIVQFLAATPVEVFEQTETVKRAVG